MQILSASKDICTQNVAKIGELHYCNDGYGNRGYGIIMRFFNREKELKLLSEMWRNTENGAKMVVLTGRRRIGKTSLCLEFAKKHTYTYLFVEKKSELLLCQEWLVELKKKLTFPIIGEIKTFKEIFHLILEHAKQHKTVLIIDEFQDFFTVNPAVFSEVQNLWDQYKQESKLFVIFVGSIYSMMSKIFQDSKEPLFGRADRIVVLDPFSIASTSKLLKEHQITDIRTLFDFYVLTGGMPKYLEILLAKGSHNFDSLLDCIVGEFSPFLDEGRYLLIEEFGKEYFTYFSILELIAMGKTSRPEIESILGRDVGGYLERLERDYAVIVRLKPFGEKSTSRLIKFFIKDNFLNFWFRFLYRNRQAIESKNFSYVKETIYRDYSTYSGKFLEKFFIELLAHSGMFNRFGPYWEKGYQNEIDIVAANDMKKKLLIAEVKLNPKQISLDSLKRKAYSLAREYGDYKIEYKGFSLQEAAEFLPE